MSKTYRRKSGHVPYWVGTDWGYVDGHFRRINLEGKELKKDLAKFHGDHGYVSYASCGLGPGVWFRRAEQHKHRMDAKLELTRFKKDNEYEVQIQQRPYLPYWD